jgi:molybdenum cofactor cytidylyltransferase
MQFEEIETAAALGWSLAHSVTAGGRKLAKGTCLSQANIDVLLAAGVKTVHAFRLEPGDIDEDEAAHRGACHLAGGMLKVGRATRGRCNLYAEADGLLVIGDRVTAFNAADEALTVATLPNHAVVRAGQLVATVKVIPYGIADDRLESALQAASALAVAPFSDFTAHFLVSGNELSDKTQTLTERRLAAVGGRIDAYVSCRHTLGTVCGTLHELRDRPGDLILMLGVSAISDRRDILPAALEEAGGKIIQLGMPVDPGNLLMLGQLGDKTVIGLPGCARSPALNGLDWVLERFAARLPLDATALRGMGIGGLLKETAQRPEPRAPRQETSTAVQPLVLAAGRSSRAGNHSKLLRRLNGKTVIAETVSVASRATNLSPVVVTGHEADAVTDTLSGYACTLIHNGAYAAGMASSLKAGLDALDPAADFCLICLGDMPFVREETIRALQESAARMGEARLFIPTFNGKRGHPILWHRDMLTGLKAVTGDKGGRDIIHAHEALVCEVAVSDPGILIDLDTPELLAQFGLETPETNN